MLTRRGSLAGLASMTLTAPLLAQGTNPPGTVGIPERPLDIRMFGAKGNRRDLDDEPIARTIAAALTNDQYPSSIFVSAGHYRRACPIALPNHIVLRGEGYSSVFNSQDDATFAAPILSNATGSAIGWRLADLSLFGGSHGIKLDITSEAANLRFDNVAMLMQKVANIEANKLFQTTRFFGGVLGSAPYGLKVDGWTTNAFNSFGLEWTDHTNSSIYLRGAEGVLVVGGRFEGSGRAAQATIDIEDGASITFFGVYFENVHEYLARLRRVQVVSFVNCHFTGTLANSPTTFAPFKWDIDSSLLTFRDCHSSLPMPVPGNVILDGANANIFPAHAVHTLHGLHGTICGAPRPVMAEGTIDLLTAAIGRVVPGGDGLFDCRLTLTVAQIGAPDAIEHWHGTFAIVEQGGACHLSLPAQQGIELGRTMVTVAVVDGNRLVARYRGSGRAGTFLSWTIEWRRIAGSASSSLVLHVP